MNVTVKNGTMKQAEINAYIAEVKGRNPGREITDMTLTVDGDYVDVSYEYKEVPFQRIRRITGYLVGTLDKFNDAKRAEESQRVKHSM